MKIFNLKEPKENFLSICKANYFQNVTPGNPNCKENIGYKKLVEIAMQYFVKDEYYKFSGYLHEGQYLVQLWTAHLILEYGKPKEELKRICIEEIIKYSESSLSSEIANEEQEWLRHNIIRFNNDKK